MVVVGVGGRVVVELVVVGLITMLGGTSVGRVEFKLAEPPRPAAVMAAPARAQSGPAGGNSAAG